MSDFGAGTCDFYSEFASDFRTEWNDYAGDFGGEPRTAKWTPEAPGHRKRTTGAGYSRRQGHGGTRTEASWQRTAQAAHHGAGGNAAPQGHKQGPQDKRECGGIGIAPNIKTPYRRVKMANEPYSRKAAGIHQKQRKTPHSVSHAGRRQY